MKFSALYERYQGLRTPTFTLTVNGKQLDVGEGVRLERMECRLTARREAGTLSLRAELEPDSRQSGTWLSAVQLGAVCTLALGYGGTEQTVFSGFVYDALWGAPLRGGRLALEMTCLDVRGQLMLSACADAGAARTLSQLVKTLLNQSCCTRMASPRLGTIPQDWDLPFQRTGATDFEILCQAAAFLCFAFYAFGKDVYFGPPRDSAETAVHFDGPNGLMELSRRRTLAGQCGAVAVSGADDKGERIYARQARTPDSGVGVGQIKSALGLDVLQAETAVRTMAQAQYLAQARMEERQRRSSVLLGRCTGLPELGPGKLVQADGVSAQVDGEYYVQTVVHTLDDSGFETSFEAEE